MQVDCVIVDEAGQISLGAISLVLRSLAIQGRIIIAGDSEQLAPILTAQYPQSKSGSLFGSVLDCFRFAHLHSKVSESQEEADVPASQSTIVQLTENFRLNPDLGEFISTIYARRFRPQKGQARQLAMALKSLSSISNETLIGIQPTVTDKVQSFLVALSHVMLNQPQDILVEPEIHSIAPTVSSEPGAVFDTSLMHRPVSLSLIRLQTTSLTDHVGYESHVHVEAAVAASLVKLLQSCSPDEDIFVATPHRIQREAVNAALSRVKQERIKGNLDKGFQRLSTSRSKVTVDTVERLQGSEAAFVICLFSLPKAHTSGLGFLLERRRLNVAISRAKALCILVTSDEVLRPSVKVLADEEIAIGYTFLKAYEKRAWTYDLAFDLDNFFDV
ncbi:hypothetical protein BDN70DRAFT_794739 [Pholiota conissans]|uniref:DNA2/NAM7 helicase-like C-terminal domain-containing protein n=1 Tax=Pholiota conissans TaxID=109636 RepID=A0A9P5ZDE5_9AGAR|nr:hypothetical protein BDN70DRAFT_794739 [Pholiota conissans]